MNAVLQRIHAQQDPGPPSWTIPPRKPQGSLQQCLDEMSRQGPVGGLPGAPGTGNIPQLGFGPIFNDSITNTTINIEDDQPSPNDTRETVVERYQPPVGPGFPLPFPPKQEWVQVKTEPLSPMSQGFAGSPQGTPVGNKGPAQVPSQQEPENIMFMAICTLMTLMNISTTSITDALITE